MTMTLPDLHRPHSPLARPILRVLVWLILIVFMAPLGAWGQEGVNVNLSQGPPVVPYQKLFFYSGSNLTYICMTTSPGRQTSTFTISSATSATPAVFTSTSHGFFVTGPGALGRPKVTISGAPTAWAAINGTWILSAVDANTFQLLSPTTGTAFDGVGIAAWSGTATVTTNAPRTTLNIWAIQRLTYDGFSNLITLTWALGPQGLTSSLCTDPTAATIEYR